MDKLKAYFKEKTSNLSFIEIKEGSYVDINGHLVKSDIPLPLLIDELVKDIKNNKAEEEIRISSVINGIIYLFASDPDFKYLPQYKEILYSYDEKIEDFIMFKGMKHVEEGKLEDGIIYFRALANINGDNIWAKYYYSCALEEKANKFYKNKDNKMGNIFLAESTRIFESMIDMDSSFPMAYYKLGFHYKHQKQFKKSQMMWEKFLQLSDNEDNIEEIKQELMNIEDSVAYEEGYIDVLNGKAEEGLKKLVPLKEKYSDWWNLLFMIGLGYRQLGLYSEAKKEFENVIAINSEQADAFNELGLCLAYLGQHNEAINMFTKAIELRPQDSELFCNRGMTYLQLNDLEKAEEDISKAYKLNPNDEVTMACKNELDRAKNIE